MMPSSNDEEPKMSAKPFLVMALLLPLVAISPTAHAGSTITDKSYWPNEARPAANGQGSMARNAALDAFASGSISAPRQVGVASTGWRYHGGPKFSQ
jgi:hypothetical protein